MNGSFLDLKDLTGLSTDTAKQLNYVLSKVPEVDATEKAYGIDLSDSPIFKELQFAGNEPVLAILANGKNKEMSVKFIEWLFKQTSL
jgi:hypothetical protein